jgi:lipopolysaccharide export system permease protein
MHLTLSAYIGRLFAFWFVSVFAGIAGIVYMLDSIELLRRAQRVEVPISLLLKLSALKLPQLLMELFPFVVLFAAMLCFWRLARNHELTVVRASGVSVWQFLAPVIVLALTIGAVRVGLLNPLAAALYSRHETLEAEVFQGRGSQMAAAQNGFWLRQAGSEGNAVIHALRVASERMELFDVIIWTYERPQPNGEQNDRFTARIDARTARLEAGAWILSDAAVSLPDRPARYETTYRLPTDMTAEQIQDAFAAPETISFWELPGFIRALENAGFSARRHLLHFHRLLASPLLLAAMILVAATVSLRPPRRGGALAMAVIGISAGFVLYFASNLVAALGLSRAIPIHLAAWAPASVMTLLGISLLLHQEDG